MATTLVPAATRSKRCRRAGGGAHVPRGRGRLPEFAAWLDARYIANISYDDVNGCAPGTLGHGVKGLFDKGFQLQFGRIGPAVSDFEYIRKRRGQVHDIEHMVTGFPGTAFAGEMALYVANMISTYGYFQRPSPRRSRWLSPATCCRLGRCAPRCTSLRRSCRRSATPWRRARWSAID